MKLKSLLMATVATGIFALSMSAHAVGPAYNGGSTYGYVCTHQGSNVMLRSGPGQKYKVLARMPSGSDVSVIGEREVGGWLWYKVKYGRNVGWARHDYICG